MTKNSPENPAIELLLYSGTCRSLLATLRFFINIRRGKVQFLLGVAAIAQMWVVIQDAVPRPVFAATGLVLVALIIFDLFEWIECSGRPASPTYIEAAMRHVDPADRLDLLARIDTVALRGELKPVSIGSVIEIVKALKRQRASNDDNEHARQSRHARLQAALIDAYRSV
jgi:hypothetical protein